MKLVPSTLLALFGSASWASAQTENLAEVATSSGLSTLVAAASVTGQAAALVADNDLTVFGPTDAAFAALPAGALAYLLANVDVLSSVLGYHIVPGTVLSTDLTEGMTATTLSMGSLSFSIVEGIALVNDAVISLADLLATNGVVHVIDRVLTPPDFSLPPNLVETAISDGSFNTLVAAVTAAGLAETLTSDLFTIFAPTDDAFAALPSGALEYLLANTDILTEVLLYHVTAGAILAGDLSDDMMVPTLLEGTSVTVDITNGMITIDGATVVTADVTALNGVIHVIDQVLLPPAFSLPSNLVETAIADGSFNTLVAAVTAAGLGDALTGSILTVFAPTDTAFEALPSGALEYLLANTDILTEVLLYHVTAGAILSNEIATGMEISTLLEGTSLMVDITNSILSINGATVVTADVTALNGVIHAIDQVLLPPAFSLPSNLVETAIADGRFNTLVAAVTAAGLGDALTGSILTVFAPTDAAFEALPSGALEYLLANTDILTEVLLYHVTAGAILAGGLSDDMMVPTLLEGTSVTVDITNGMITIDGATVVTADATALNGVIHVIDQVLLPPGVTLPIVPVIPEFAFLVSMISMDQDWCVTATSTRTDRSLGFRPCDFSGKPANQQFKFVDGQLVSKIDSSRCVQVGFGEDAIVDGMRLRLGSCSNTLTVFESELDTKFFRVLHDTQYCISNRGPNPNTSDTIHAKECIHRPDYMWELVVV